MYTSGFIKNHLSFLNANKSSWVLRVQKRHHQGVKPASSIIAICCYSLNILPLTPIVKKLFCNNSIKTICYISLAETGLLIRILNSRNKDPHNTIKLLIGTKGIPKVCNQPVAKLPVALILILFCVKTLFRDNSMPVYT